VLTVVSYAEVNPCPNVLGPDAGVGAGVVGAGVVGAGVVGAGEGVGAGIIIFPLQSIILPFESADKGHDADGDDDG